MKNLIGREHSINSQLISSGETSANRDIFFTDDAVKTFFSDQHKKFAISFSLFCQT